MDYTWLHDLSDDIFFMSGNLATMLHKADTADKQLYPKLWEQIMIIKDAALVIDDLLKELKNDNQGNWADH